MQHRGEITFYEELGVAPNATAEEIRNSFRALVRILHPDHQTDPQLQEIAERQMRKLNRVYAVLSDAASRRHYDDALEGNGVRPAIILSQRLNSRVWRLRERAAWVIALVAVVTTLVWLSSENPVASQSPVSERSFRKAPGVVAETSNESAQMQSDLHLMKMERDAAVRELARLRGLPARTQYLWRPPEPLISAAPRPTDITVELPGPAAQPGLVPATTPSPRQSSAILNPFTGFWFYSKSVPGQRRKAPASYSPEFIEATISEQNGLVRGRYRSRYKVVDRAISPDVTFEFSGTAHGSTVICLWNGAGGSKGELSLKIVDENSLLVDWTATRLGSTQGLVTGAATLIRRIE